LDNTLVRRSAAPGGVAVSALVDWELSTIGDPLADVAMMCAYRDPAFDLIVGAPSSWTSPRLPSAGELVQQYVAAGGSSTEGWNFHLALAYFKVGVIAAGIDHRYRAGASSGPGFDTSGKSVQRYLELAADALRRP
jgi:aminoglycoside phosphotransferase (APT) family kinase protein